MLPGQVREPVTPNVPEVEEGVIRRSLDKTNTHRKVDGRLRGRVASIGNATFLMAVRRILADRLKI